MNGERWRWRRVRNGIVRPYWTEGRRGPSEPPTTTRRFTWRRGSAGLHRPMPPRGTRTLLSGGDGFCFVLSFYVLILYQHGWRRKGKQTIGGEVVEGRWVLNLVGRRVDVNADVDWSRDKRHDPARGRRRGGRGGAVYLAQKIARA